MPDDYLAIKDALGGIRAAQSKADAACSKLRDWREIEEATYDALDMIRAHPVVNDLLDRGGVDSERWYKDAGYILESLVARLIGGVGRRTSSAADSDTAVTIRAPRTAWALLLETLTLDARSSAFDPKLRKQIVQALRQVAEVDAPYILVTVKSGIPEASVFWDQGMAIKAAKREAKSLNPENDVAVVLHQGEEVFSWPQEP